MITLPESTVPTPAEVAETTRKALATYGELIAAAEARGDSESAERLRARVRFLESL